jgi:hypothetical protein
MADPRDDRMTNPMPISTRRRPRAVPFRLVRRRSLGRARFAVLVCREFRVGDVITGRPAAGDGADTVDLTADCRCPACRAEALLGGRALGHDGAWG